MNTPVLLIVFNRPELTSATLKAISVAKPPKLYVAQDGPRHDFPDDIRKCKEVQELFSDLEWECELHTLFRQDNLGCGLGPVEAINWAFQSEDRLIILEDDLVASKSFFDYCSKMLDLFENNSRIGMISGRSHHSDSSLYEPFDVVFSHMPHSLGWATWKNRWEKFSINMADYTSFVRKGGAKPILLSNERGRYYDYKFKNMFKRIKNEVSHSWDGQWLFCMMNNDWLGVVPSVNMIKNIGEQGTHSKGHSLLHDLEAQEMPEHIRIPSVIAPNESYERFHFTNHILRGTKIKAYLIMFILGNFGNLYYAYLKPLRNRIGI